MPFTYLIVFTYYQRKLNLLQQIYIWVQLFNSHFIFFISLLYPYTSSSSIYFYFSYPHLDFFLQLILLIAIGNNFCFINIVYFWQTNNIWQGIMFILTLSYIILTYFEPSNSRDTEFQLDSSITSYEYSVISILFVDLIFEITHLLFDYERMMVDKFFKNFKFLLKFLFDMLLLADCFYFYTMFPQSALRFARYVRPCNYNLISGIFY